MRDYLILGPLEVRRDGRTVDLGSPKQRVVLGALLVARGSVVSTDRLIDAVWGQSPPAAATTSLQAYISNLRRALRDGTGDASPLERVNPGYRLNLGGDRLDVDDFGALGRAAHDAVDDERWEDASVSAAGALALWRGRVLEDMGDEKWVAVEAAAVEETRLAVTEAHVTALLAHGDTATALREISALRSADPLRDRAAWLHIVTLYRAGRAADALAEYSVHARALADELGLDPSVELRDLQSAILRHDPVIAAWPRPPHWSGAARMPVPAEDSVGADQTVATGVDDAARQAVSGSTDLIGRDVQLRQFAAMVEGRASSTRWVALSGPAGIGKTRLAQEAARLARAAGDQVCWVRCPDAEGMPAWWPLRQLCRDLGADAADVLSVPTGVDADAARFAVYERVEALIGTAAAAQPVTIVVDDVQWADAMSVGLLRYLTTVLRESPVWVVMTVRDEQIGAETSRLLGAIARVDGLVIDVPHLERDDVAALVAQVAEEDVGADALDVLCRRTGGNPLFVSEYARLPADQRREAIPAAVRSVLDRRLASLDPAVLEVLGYAAVAGDEIDVAFLAQVMNRDIDSVADCLDEAADERIVTTSPANGATVFAHALLRDEAMRTVRPLRRCRIHLRVAETAAALGGPDAVARRAAHLLDAAPLSTAADVIDACRAAADEATARWDSENAAYWLESALGTYESQPEAEQDAAERDALLIDMLGAYLRAGRAQLVLDTVESRLAESIRNDEPASAGRLAGALLRAGGGWPWVPPAVGTTSLHLELSRALPVVADDDAAAARVSAALAIGHCYHPDPAVPADLLRDAAEHAARVQDPELTHDVELARLITYSGVAARASETIDRARALVDAAPATATLDSVIVDSVLTMATMTCGDIEATERHLRRGIEGSELMRLPILRAQLRWMEAALAVWRGEFDRARDHFRTALAVHQQTELYVAGSGALAVMALASSQEVFDELVDEVLGITGADRLQWARDAVTAAPGNIVVALLAAGVASIAGARGDTELAGSMIDAWLADTGPMIWTSLAQAVILAGVAVDLRMTDCAARFVEYLEPFAGCIATVGQVGCVGPVDLALVGLYRLQGRRDRAVEALDRADALAERTGSAPNLLRCRLVELVDGARGPRRDNALAALEAQARSMGLRSTAEQARLARS